MLQGRYKAILVQKETYLLELTRYVVLNPLRAGMATQPEDWPWSSYLAMIGEVSVPPWLEADWLLAQFASQRKRAIQAYRRFVREGQGLPRPWDQVQHQLLLGDDALGNLFRQNNGRV